MENKAIENLRYKGDILIEITAKILGIYEDAVKNIWLSDGPDGVEDFARQFIIRSNSKYPYHSGTRIKIQGEIDMYLCKIYPNRKYKFRPYFL